MILMLRKKGVLLAITALMSGMLLAGCSEDNSADMEIEKGPNENIEEDFGKPASEEESDEDDDKDSDKDSEDGDDKDSNEDDDKDSSDDEE